MQPLFTNAHTYKSFETAQKAVLAAFKKHNVEYKYIIGATEDGKFYVVICMGLTHDKQSVINFFHKTNYRFAIVG